MDSHHLIRDVLLSGSYLFDDVLPLVSLAFGQYVHPDFLDKLDHLKLSLHPAPSLHDPANAFLRREKFQRLSAYACVLFSILKEEHETVKGWDALAEF